MLALSNSFLHSLAEQQRITNPKISRVNTIINLLTVHRMKMFSIPYIILIRFTIPSIPSYCMFYFTIVIVIVVQRTLAAVCLKTNYAQFVLNLYATKFGYLSYSAIECLKANLYNKCMATNSLKAILHRHPNIELSKLWN